ncbi:MAG: hypothetical protein B6D71_09875 [gamma proteobacterium symbiont of Stewartia floridana]|nr:MAG: hypothetical protein B6D71_09875 [gamma proteobacterium symbiont of Stewartia floridana]
MTGLIVLLIVTLGSAILCHRIAKKRGGNGAVWGLIGLLLGPIAIPFVFLVRPKPGNTEN